MQKKPAFILVDILDEFIDLARAVYVSNDERAAIKKRINLQLGSRLVEEKSYKPYGPGPA